MRSESIFAVQTLLAGGEEAELRFRASFMRQDDGALSLWDQPDPNGPERMIMAFAASAWRGAWLVDPATSFPLGLELASAPSSRPPSPLASHASGAPVASSSIAPIAPVAPDRDGAASASQSNQNANQNATASPSPAISPAPADQAWPASYQPAPETQPAPEPAAPSMVALAAEPSSLTQTATQTATHSASIETPTSPLADQPQARPEPVATPDAPRPSTPEWSLLDPAQRVELVAQAVMETPYSGLAPLAERLRAPIEEAEQALASAIGKRRIDPQAVQDPALQALMDAINPELIRAHRPQKPSDIIDLLRQRDDTASVDLVQLRIWLLRNPPKRPA